MLCKINSSVWLAIDFLGLDFLHIILLFLCFAFSKGMLQAPCANANLVSTHRWDGEGLGF